MFNQPQAQTPEQKIEARAAAIAQDIYNEEAVLKSQANKRGAYNHGTELRREIYKALNEKPAAAPKAENKKGMKYGKGFIEYGKTYKSGRVAFTLHDPVRLSDKQKAVVLRFIRDLTGGLALPFEEIAPWIDVIFMLNRGEVTMSQFQSITKIDMSSLSTSDARHDHNL